MPRSRLARLARRVADPLVYLRAVILVAGVGLVALPFAADAVNAALHPVGSAAGNCRVIAVIDGDTVTLWCPGRGAERARLDGFDAPELFSPGCTRELVAAERAKWALRLMIFRADEIGVRHTGTDRYGRALVRMTIDGRPLAARMIGAGHARPYAGGQRQSWCS